MLLIIADDGKIAKETADVLSPIDVKCLFHFEDISEVITMSSASVIVGDLSLKSLDRIVYENDVDCIVDISVSPNSQVSLISLTYCEENDLPIIRFSKDRSNTAINDRFKDYVIKTKSYRETSDYINKLNGNTLFLLKPSSSKAISDNVFDRSTIFVPIKQSVEFDVDLALDYGVPIMNVFSYNDTHSVQGLNTIIKKYDIKLLVTDSEFELNEKILCAKENDLKLIIAPDSGFEYNNICDSYDKLYETVFRMYNIDE